MRWGGGGRLALLRLGRFKGGVAGAAGQPSREDGCCPAERLLLAEAAPPS